MSHTHDDEFDALRPLIDGVHAKEIDQPRIVAAVREILEAIGEDPDRDGLQSTPSRVARMYAEVCSGLHQDPAEHLKTTFEAGHDEMVMVRDIPLYSLCEHHLTPFLGKAHVAYIPNENGRVTGLSKLARLVDGYAKRPQVQERMTETIANLIETELDTAAVAVVIEASHSCMTARGVRTPGVKMTTSRLFGCFLDDARSREEVMSLMGY